MARPTPVGVRFWTSRALTPAAVQIGPIRPALSQHERYGPQHLQTFNASRLEFDAADLQSQGGERMAPCGRGSVITNLG